MKIFLSLLVFFTFLISGDASQVIVKGEKGSWCLFVDGRPFRIKGVGCGVAIGKNGEDYLKMAKDLGANCVRTWGIDQGNSFYLNRANKYGLKVCAGIWIDYSTPDNKISFLRGSYKRKKEKEVLEYIKRFKDHPAILIWGLGNECIYFTQSEEEKIALCKFIENLVKKIHKIDPYHPVMYVSAGYVDLKYIKKYIPSLDIIGMNIYGSLRAHHGVWEYLDINKPYIVSEYGPLLPIDSSQDKNGIPVELPDFEKAKIYKSFYFDIEDFSGYNLGGFVFHLGETTQESMTWWNINYRSFKKYPYWIIYELYTGKKADNLPPRIRKFQIDRIKVKKGEWVKVKIEASDPEGDPLRYEFKVSTCIGGVLRYYVNKFINTSILQNGNEAQVFLPSKKGIYRVYGFVYDNKGNVSSRNLSVKVE